MPQSCAIRCDLLTRVDTAHRWMRSSGIADSERAGRVFAPCKSASVEEEMSTAGAQVAEDLRGQPSDGARRRGGRSVLYESPEPSFEPSPEPLHDESEAHLSASLLNAAAQVLQSQDELMNVIIHLDAQRESLQSDFAKRAPVEEYAQLSAVDDLEAFDIPEEEWKEYRAQLVQSGYSAPQIATMENEIHAVRAMVHGNISRFLAFSALKPDTRCSRDALALFRTKFVSPHSCSR